MFGYMGKLSFGHAAFFGLGAYAAALVITKTNLPFLVMIPVAVVVTGIIGIIVGFFCVRRSGMYFSMLTMGFGQLLYVVVFKWYSFTGGDDGIQGIPIPAVLELTKCHYYYILIMVALATFLMWRILHGPFGYVLRAIRDNTVRTQFNGVNVVRVQLVAFVIACIFAGFAGALFAPFNRAVSPQLLDFTSSAQPVNMTIIGGQYTFFGPVIGSAIFSAIQTLVLEYTYYWPFVIGVILIATILFLPGGVVGFFTRRK